MCGPERCFFMNDQIPMPTPIFLNVRAGEAWPSGRSFPQAMGGENRKRGRTFLECGTSGAIGHRFWRFVAVVFALWSTVQNVQGQGAALEQETTRSKAGEASVELQSPMTEYYKEVLEAHTAIIQRDPKDSGAYLQRALAKCYLREYAAALADYDRAIGLAPGTAEAYKGRALVKWLLRAQENDPEGAQLDYARALKSDPLAVRGPLSRADFFYAERARTRRERNDYLGALEDFEKVIVLNTPVLEGNSMFCAGIFANRGGVLKELNDFKGAIAAYTRALELDPWREQVFLLRGDAKQKMRDFRGALEDYDLAILSNEECDAAYMVRGNLKQRLHDYEGAIEDYSLLIEKDSQTVLAYLERANAKWRMGNFQGAIADCDAALGINSKYVDAYNQRGKARESLGDSAGAMAEYEKALELEGQHVKASVNRAQVRYGAGDMQGAINDLTHILESSPKCAEASLALSDIYRMEKEISRAWIHVQNAIGSDPDLPQGYETRAMLKLSKGDRAGAIADYERAGELDPGGGISRIGRYFLHVLWGEWKEAEIALQEMDEILQFPVSEVFETQVLRFLTGAMTQESLLSFKGFGPAKEKGSVRAEIFFCFGIRCLTEAHPKEASEQFLKAMATQEKQSAGFEWSAFALGELRK